MVNQTETKIVYLGDGKTTVFPFSFAYDDVDDVHVMRYDAATDKETVLTGDYYIDQTAGTVTYPGYAPGQEPAEADRPAVLTAGEKLVIFRETPITQLTDLGEKYPLPILEKMDDKLTFIAQEMTETLSRCIKNGMASDTTFDGLLVEFHASIAAAAAQAKASAEAADTSAAYADAAKASAANASAAAQDASDAQISSSQSAAEAERLTAALAAMDVPAWDAEAVYSYPTVVAYTDGQSYRCIGENVPAGEAPNASRHWIPLTVRGGDDYFEVDMQGALEPRLSPHISASWCLDDDGNLMPRATEDEMAQIAATTAETAAADAKASAEEAATSQTAAAAAQSAAETAQAAAEAAKADAETAKAAAQAASCMEKDSDGNVTVQA